MSLRRKLILIIIITNILAILGIYILVSVTTQKSIVNISTENSRSLLRIAMLTIENQYKSLTYHQGYITAIRKRERKNIIASARSILEYYYSAYQRGSMSKQEAKKLSVDVLNKIRYDNGNGYIWISDTEKPVPRIINHPFYPEYNNKLAKAPLFYTTSDSSNIMLMAAELCEKQDSGYIEYYWSKPGNKQDSLHKKKLSYVELYKPWNWVLGTGVYLEDIEEDTENRLHAIEEELQNTLGKIKIFESGYFFIFDSQLDVIIHPVLLHENPDSAIYRSSIDLLKEIRDAANAGKDSYEYSWIIPRKDENDFHYKKKVFMQYFEPLDWYVCVSLYKQELEKPKKIIGQRMFIFTVCFLLLTIFLAIILSDSLARPIHALMKFVKSIPTDDSKIDTELVPITGSKETRSLGLAMKNMLKSIENYKQNLLKEKVRFELSEHRLRLSEHKYKNLFNSSGDAAIIFRNQKITECNERALKILKGTRQQVIGLSLFDISPDIQPDGANSKNKVRRLIEKASITIPIEFEWLHKNLNNELLNIDVTLICLDEEKNNFLATWRDITEKKKAQKNLKESELRYRFLVENNPSVFWILNKSGTFTYISRNVNKRFGYDYDEIQGLTVNEYIQLVHPEDREELTQAINTMFSKGKGFDINIRVKSKTNGWRWVQDTGQTDDKVFGDGIAYGLLTDITEKKLNEQNILQAIVRSEEAERSRIAKDLHDGVSPLLSAIKLFTQSMRDSSGQKNKEELSEKISFTIGEAIRTINEISANISPHILQNFGLIKAVESFTTNVSYSSAMNCNIASRIKERLPLDIETTLYRISVELVNNAIKHSKAKNIMLDYRIVHNSVYMNYTDDGTGFNVQEVNQRGRGMGLFNMRNRVESLAGKFKLSSDINKGVQISIKIPLENNE